MFILIAQKKRFGISVGKPLAALPWFWSLGFASENPLGALTLPLSPVSAPSTVSLGSSFTHCPSDFQQWLSHCTQCALYSAEQTLLTCQYALQAQHTLYTVLCTLYSAHCTLHTVLCTLYTVLCTLYSKPCSPASTHCTLCTQHFLLLWSDESIADCLSNQHYTVNSEKRTRNSRYWQYDTIINGLFCFIMPVDCQDSFSQSVPKTIYLHIFITTS